MFQLTAVCFALCGDIKHQVNAYVEIVTDPIPTQSPRLAIVPFPFEEYVLKNITQCQDPNQTIVFIDYYESVHP